VVVADYISKKKLMRIVAIISRFTVNSEFISHFDHQLFFMFSVCFFCRYFIFFVFVKVLTRSSILSRFTVNLIRM
jgi:hypothetical protein